MTEHVTGDLARLDGGRTVLTGRSKDMTIRGTVNIYPGLHEPVITRLPGVAAALLIGVPDAIGDERVVLALVPAPDAAPGLVDRVAVALPGVIDASALPDEIVSIDAVPVAGRTRKPDRAALRARLARTETPTRDVVRALLGARGLEVRVRYVPVRVAWAVAGGGRSSRYAVSHLRYERTLDLTAGRERLGLDPAPTSVAGAGDW
ncbi:MAG: hypothetical protein LH603_14365 [Pseudonocardia sp.]|nr:hypothetical protein [Pseudonocardia sp.]